VTATTRHGAERPDLPAAAKAADRSAAQAAAGLAQPTRPSAPQAGSVPDPPEPSHAAVVLVVDDDEDHRRLIARRLADAGHLVRTAGSGEEALGALDGVDLVLLDYRLPGSSGLETLQRIRERDGPSVVMVTGMGSESIAVEALRAGAIDYLVKDIGYLAELPRVVERAVRTHDLARRARRLEDLARVVTSALERDAALDEIVSGARELLRADACQLWLADASGLDPAPAATCPALPGGLSGARPSRRPAQSPEPDAPTTELVVPVASPEGDLLGMLGFLTAEARRYLPEELELARTFAAFAGVALGNLRRLELEHALVAELQTVLDLRRDLATQVSHELRTPIACVRGFAETLLAHWGELDDTRRYDLVRRIGDHAGRLSELVEDLLELGTVEAGRLSPDQQTVELALEARRAVEALAPVLADRPVRVEGGAVATADPALLQRVLANLLTNAAKFSEPGTPVVVRIRATGSEAEVEVQDRGVGLSPEEQARVFEPFWRAPEARRLASRGTGIGLALVRAYVRAMGGDVGVTSTPGRGSTFRFTLPGA
jgi:signal transduction histidine kinase/FixJ family two-component response regulator